MEFFKKKTSFRFMGLRRQWYVVSGVLILASFLLLAFRGLNFGIDFHGRRGPRVVVATGGGSRKGPWRTRGGWVRRRGRAELRHLARRAGPRPAREGMDVNAVSAKVLTALQTYEPASELRRTEWSEPRSGRSWRRKVRSPHCSRSC